MSKSVEVRLWVPESVDKFWHAIGYDEKDYQIRFLDSLRAQMDAVASDAPKAHELEELLQKTIKEL